MVLYTLVPATDADFNFAYELKKTAYREYIEQTWGWDETFQVKFHEEHFSPENTKIIIVHNRSVGTVDVKEDDQNIFISGLYLLPEYQAKGIGSSIVGAIMKRAEASKKRVELEVLRVNRGAQRLYKRLGFRMSEGDETKYLMFKEH